MSAGVSVADVESFHFEGVEIAPGTGVEVSLELGAGPAGNPRSIPVYVLHGTKPGPVLGLVAGIHGDELNGVSVVHHLIHGDDHIANTDDDTINRKQLSGTLICVPVVNIEGMLLEQRGAPDNRDINRLFPGKRDGNQSQRIAFALFQGVVNRADYLIDLHSAPHSRTNLPHVRADFDKSDCLDLARAFGTQIILHSNGPKGSLRREASKKGTPTILLEAGTAHRFEMEAVHSGIEGVLNVMGHLGMINRKNRQPAVRLLVRRSKWARAEAGGLLYSLVKAGDHVEKGQKIALITDPLGAKTHTVESPRTGVIVGLAINPLVRAGDPIANIVLCSAAKWRRSQVEPDAEDPEEESVDDEESVDEA
ncbi:MAG: succinylglutamate desuccinylase/aspartoacylase family protein [Candidatus Thermoplasmatota archaeon]|nr:succinylglutamate desuccinylase/aspartoacylase family protein [Candidatus Thermoplasmatota archaeon]